MSMLSLAMYDFSQPTHTGKKRLQLFRNAKSTIHIHDAHSQKKRESSQLECCLNDTPREGEIYMDKDKTMLP